MKIQSAFIFFSHAALARGMRRWNAKTIHDRHYSSGAPPICFLVQ